LSTKKKSSRKKRLQTTSVRNRHLLAAVTHEEKREIIKYCTDRRIAISQFLAEIVLREARYKGKRALGRVVIDLPYQQHAKIDYLAAARGATVEECIYELIQPSLDKQRAWNTPKEEILRYYLSGEEHKLVTQYMAKHNLSSRHFLGLLAKRHIAHVRSGGKETRGYPWNRKAK
jgi:hypothetical protein